MTDKDLKSRLRRLEADLEDLKETIGFNLSYTSAHIGGAEVRKDEEALNRLRQEIERIRSLLEEGQAPSAVTVHEVIADVIEYTGDDGNAYYAERLERKIPTADIDFNEGSILGCEACSQHGRNLACPPFSPPFARYAGGKENAIVIGYRISLEQFPHEEIEDRYHAAFKKMRGLLVSELLEERRLGKLVAGAGACLACKECAAVQGEKGCRNPDEMIYSLESMGVNIISLSEKALDLRLQWSSANCTADNVTAIGAVFYD